MGRIKVGGGRNQEFWTLHFVFTCLLISKLQYHVDSEQIAWDSGQRSALELYMCESSSYHTDGS